MLSVTPIPAFSDNYIWLLRQDTSDSVCVVDPGDAAPVIEWLEREGLTLGTILITHHHPDHTGGLAELIQRYSPRVIGPHNPSITGIDERVGDGDEIRVMGRLFEVLELPGHTLDHIAFFTAGIPPLLFSGDVLFSAGCGRLFEGSPEQMHQSLSRLDNLPEEALVFAAHEYTLANLRFAKAADPGNKDVIEAENECLRARELERPTLPSTLGRERRINPFLRCGEEGVRRAAAEHGATDTELATFTTLRAWKDSF
ncbi:hydroxyacylglutathione hydrolase [Halomonas elongata]|uniref:Hydroxyacylglutathione hydrolase n=2 Tax=Halomonas elongata TaxID=2746 RepID=E1V399_HALED|nr:hydroxyacylglutathione hydrolase [Halomonas elongata]MBW5800601.1 hydroxyacylglutathione hydrolase [Halomonas elongata]MDL4862927.1 hydroxyacylglutathione hydrolase [Halomonas elongata]OBX36295.1 hydroxyacylglutathione hydrolase [Halomonas elongata]RAW07857.1 hydroxyacylglutathione hydrolase [Halomonas elongata]WBF19874.1 hydroxyacylglutathione hydrolase [Halomonas elongata]